MFNKNDPLIGPVQEIMKRNHAEREAARLVNEKFGVTDRKALPHEKQNAWDAAYQSVLTEGVEALDEKVEMTKKQFANLDGDPKFTANDLAHARAGTHKKKAATGELEEAQKMNIDAAVAARKTSKMADKAKTPEEREELLAKMRKYKSQVRMEEGKMDIRAAMDARIAAKKAAKAKTPEEREELERKSKMYQSQVRMKEDVTSPSSMGIKKPDYASGTPAYANKGPQMVNRAAKTSLPSGTVAKAIKEASERQKSKISDVMGEFKRKELHSGSKKGPVVTDRKQAIAIALDKARNMEEGFNNRHNSSVNASASKQVVAEIAAYPGTPAGLAASSTSNSMMATQARLRAGQAAQERLAAQRSRATSATDTAPQPQPGATALARQRSGDTAPRQQGQASPMMGQGTARPLPKSPMRGQGTPAPLPKSPMSSQGAPGIKSSPGGARPAVVAKNTQTGTQASTGAQIGGARPAVVAKNTPTSIPPKPTLKPRVDARAQGAKVGGGVATKKSPVAAPAAAQKKPMAIAKKQTARPSALQRQRVNSKNYRDSAITGPGGRRG